MDNDLHKHINQSVDTITEGLWKYITKQVKGEEDPQQKIFIKPNRIINKVFIHCSASDHDHHDNITVIRGWHVNDNGWSDVGYHYFIQSDGTIQTGRSLERTPAAQKGHNTGSIAICLHGKDRFSEDQFQALRFLCQEIDHAYGDITFHGHCEVSSKSCPNFDYKEVLDLDDSGYLKTFRIRL